MFKCDTDAGHCDVASQTEAECWGTTLEQRMVQAERARKGSRCPKATGDSVESSIASSDGEINWARDG